MFFGFATNYWLLATILLASPHLALPVAGQVAQNSAAPPSAATGAPAQPTSSKKTTKKTVQLVIDYGDGFQKRFVSIPWKNEMTVEEALRFAQSHKRGIRVNSQGKGPTALLLQIDDLKNEGGRGLNWIYRVNSRLGKTGYAVKKIRPGDTVLWKFDVYK